MITRRHLMSQAAVAALAVPFASCTGGTKNDPTVAQIIASVQTGCGILLGQNGVNSVISVILTILTSFNPTLGAAATVPIAVAESVEKMICEAFMTAPPLTTTETRKAAVAAGQAITVNVNGVPVTGTPVK